MKEKFRQIRLSAANQARLVTINSIIREYQAGGYVLSLRQLYYQLVSRDIIPNKVSEYAKLSKLLMEGRMAGVVDWEAIEDRLRTPSVPARWESPEEILDAVINQYKKDRQNGQSTYLEVWVEKDALSGVLKRVTEKYHVPIVVNRGYSSVTAMHDSYVRFKDALKEGRKVTILYLGDFDPSGVDMIRDVYDRPMEMMLAKAEDIVWDAYHKAFDENSGLEDELRTLYEYEYKFPELYEKPEWADSDEDAEFSVYRAYLKSLFSVTAIALTEAQIRQYNPPRNPAKITDPRAKEFIRKFGQHSWEVDALRPEVLHQILEDAILDRIDITEYNRVLQEEKIDRARLRVVRGKLAAGEIDAEPENEDEDETEED